MRIPDWRERLAAPWNRYDPSRDSGLDLGSLLGPSFFAEAWWRKPVVLSWTSSRDRDWVEAAVSLAGELTDDRVEVVDATGRHRGRPDGDPSQAIGAQLLVLRDPHRELAHVAELRDAFAHFFRCPVTTGLYLNGPGAPGFAEHHDAHHVFAIQLVGEKTWWLGPAQVPFPTRRFLHPSAGDTATASTTVTEGQALYLPPGVRHRAECTGEVSVHLTVGVHTPRIQDALETLLDDLAAHDPGLRGPLRGAPGPKGMDWTLDREELAQRLHRLALRVGGWNTTLPEGTPLTFPVPKPVTGQWPEAEGRLTPAVAQPSPQHSLAQTAAQRLVDQNDSIRAVFLRGSALVGDAHAQDLDLLLLIDPPPDDQVAAEVAAVLQDVSPDTEWDARPVPLEHLRTGRVGPWVQLCLAAGSVLLAGAVPWTQTPPAVPGPILADALRTEWLAAWRPVASGTGLGAREVAWLQKRALRLLGLRGMAQTRQFTRHPTGCVELAERLLPAALPLATQVRDDLFAGDHGPEARARAVQLGETLLAAWA